MTTAEMVAQRVKVLPETVQAEVLDFVGYLESKIETARRREEDADWSAFSIVQAMRGMEDEPSPYSMADLREVFS